MAGETENIVDVLVRLESLLRAQFAARIGLDNPTVYRSILENLLRHSETLPESERNFYRQALLSDYTAEGVYGSFGETEIGDLIKGLRIRTETLESSVQFVREATEKLSGLSSYDFARLQYRVDDLSKQQTQISEKIKGIQREYHISLVPEGLGIDKAIYPLTRFVPVKVYVAEVIDDNIKKITYALERFCETFGFEYTDEFPAESGSWFKKWIAKSEDALSQPEVQERLQKAERSLELKILQREQSEIDKSQAEAAATLIKSLENIDDSVLQIGSLLIVKQTRGGKSKIISRTLSPIEMIHLERNTSLVKRPSDVLRELENLSKPQPEKQSDEPQTKPGEVRQRLKQRSNVKLLEEGNI